jgi:hypothetical protein
MDFPIAGPLLDILKIVSPKKVATLFEMGKVKRSYKLGEREVGIGYPSLI